MEYIKSAVFQAITEIISTFVSPLISWLYSPMLVTLLGMMMEVRPEQYENACAPILVTLLGIVMEVRLKQPVVHSGTDPIVHFDE